MGLSFKVRLVFSHTCGSHKQCIGPIEKNVDVLETRKRAIQTHTQSILLSSGQIG